MVWSAWIPKEKEEEKEEQERNAMLSKLLDSDLLLAGAFGFVVNSESDGNWLHQVLHTHNDGFSAATNQVQHPLIFKFQNSFFF